MGFAYNAETKINELTKFDFPGNIADEAHGHHADMVRLVVSKSRYEEGLQRLHVLVEVSLELVGDGTGGAEGLLVTGGVLGLEHSKDGGHDAVGVREDVLLEHLEAQDLDDAAEQTLQALLLFLVIVGQNLHLERLGKPTDDGGEELQEDGLGIRGGDLDEHADGLERHNAEVALDGVFPVGHLKEGLEERGHVTGQGVGIVGVQVVGEGGRDGMQAEAGLGGDAGSLAEELAGEGVDEGGEDLGGDGPDVHLADLADDPRRGVPDHHVLVGQPTTPVIEIDFPIIES